MRTSSKVAGAMLWAASLLTTATLFAQEELPSPPPAQSAAPATEPGAPAPKAAAPAPGAFGLRRDLPPEVRARRERLRNIGAQAIDAFLPPDGSGPAGPDGARIGAAIAPLAQALLGDGLVDTLKVKIDPAGTNLREDKVKLDSVAGMRQTPWAGDPSKFSSQVSVRIVANEAGSPMAVVDGKIQFQTQTVPLVNYALAQYKQRLAGEANQPHEGPLTSEDVLRERINAKLQTVDAIRSIDEVGDLMNEFAAIRLSVVNENIEALRTQLAQAPDDAARKEFNAALTAARVKRDRLLEVRSKTVRGKDGTAQSIALKLAMLDLIPGADMQTFDVMLTDNEITATIVGNVYQYVEFYPLAKPIVIGTLERIQAGDLQAVETLRRAINVFLGRGMKQLVEGVQPAAAVDADPAAAPAPGPPAPATAPAPAAVPSPAPVPKAATVPQPAAPKASTTPKASKALKPAPAPKAAPTSSKAPAARTTRAPGAAPAVKNAAPATNASRAPYATPRPLSRVEVQVNAPPFAPWFAFSSMGPFGPPPGFPPPPPFMRQPPQLVRVTAKPVAKAPAAPVAPKAPVTPAQPEPELLPAPTPAP